MQRNRCFPPNTNILENWEETPIYSSPKGFSKSFQGKHGINDRATAGMTNFMEVIHDSKYPTYIIKSGSCISFKEMIDEKEYS